MSKKVLVPIAEGTEEIEAVCIIDTLRRAGAEVTVASVGEKLEVAASRGVKLVADRQLADCVNETYDLIALPGGMPGAEHLAASEKLAGVLKAQAAVGRLVAAICASPGLVLASLGILDGKRATCYPGFESHFGPTTEYRTDAVVTDGKVVTSRGPGTAFAFGLALAAELAGSETAEELSRGMVFKT